MLYCDAVRVARGKSETLEGFTREEMIEDQEKELGTFDDILDFSRQTFLGEKLRKKSLKVKLA